MRALINLLVLTSILGAQTGFNKVGTVGVLFLNIPSGAAAQGMGKAYSGSAKGAEATFWNPAALGFETPLQTFSGYTRWLLGLHHQSLAVSFSAGGFGIGFSQALLTTAAMPITTTRQPRGTGASFRYFDLALGFSLARAFSDRFALGGTLKYIQESIYNLNARGYGIDIGSFYWTGYRDLRICMVLRNFGPDLRFGGSFLDTRVKGNVKEEVELKFGEFALPLTFVMGLGATVWQREGQSLLLALEANHPADYNPRLHLGGELGWGSYLKLRAGYKLNYEQESWSLGLGFQRESLAVDLAYSARQDFSGISSYSIRYIIK